MFIHFSEFANFGKQFGFIPSTLQFPTMLDWTIWTIFFQLSGYIKNILPFKNVCLCILITLFFDDRREYSTTEHKIQINTVEQIQSQNQKMIRFGIRFTCFCCPCCPWLVSWANSLQLTFPCSLSDEPLQPVSQEGRVDVLPDAPQHFYDREKTH